MRRATKARPARPVAAVLVSIVIVGLFVALVLGGAAVLRWSPSVVGLLLAAVVLGLAWQIRPWQPRLRRLRHLVLTPDVAPTLFHELDRVTQALSVSPISGVLLVPGWRAVGLRTGLRRRTMLSVGALRWGALGPEGRVGLVAVVAARLGAGDPYDSLLVEAGLRSWRGLASVFGKLAVDEAPGPDVPGRAVLEPPAVVSGRGMSRALASAVVSVVWFAVRSAGPAHHHALIEGVRRASGVVGPGPVLSMVEVATLEDVVGRRCQEAARGGDPRPLHEIAAQRAAEVPATERQRRTRIDRRSPRAIAGGVPSLAELCAATTMPRTGPRVEIPEEAWVAIAQEVGPMLAGVDDLTRQALARAPEL